MIKGIEPSKLLYKSVKENFSVCCFSLSHVGSVTFKGGGGYSNFSIFFGMPGGGPHREDCGILVQFCDQGSNADPGSESTDCQGIPQTNFSIIK